MTAISADFDFIFQFINFNMNDFNEQTIKKTHI